MLDASSVWEYRGETEREEGQGMQKAIKRSSRSLGLTLGMDGSLAKKRELGAMLWMRTALYAPLGFSEFLRATLSLAI